MISRQQLTEVGRINKPHGHAGEMSVSLSCSHDPVDIRFLIMNVDGIYVPFYVTDSRPRGMEAWLVTIEGIESDREAAVYTGYTIYALTDTLLKLNASDNDDNDADDDAEHYISADSLIGYTIEDADKELGEVTDIDTSTLNALFVVKRADDKMMLIPVADEYIDDIDTASRRIHMSLPVGLTEL